jgi:hypothetical protein
MAASSGGQRKKYPGGFKQRLKAHEEEMGSVAHSALAFHLVEQWAWGHLTGPQIQAIAAAAEADLLRTKENPEDGRPLREVRRIAALGARGASPQHTHRDMLRALEPPALAEPMAVEIPVKASSVRGWVERETHMLLPHALFASLWGTVGWEKAVCPSTDSLEGFWREMAGARPYESHPFKDRPNFVKRAVPIALFGDGIPTTGIGKSWGRSMDAWFWQSMVVRGGPRDNCLYIWSAFASTYAQTPLRSTLGVYYQALRKPPLWAPCNVTSLFCGDSHARACCFLELPRIGLPCHCSPPRCSAGACIGYKLGSGRRMTTRATRTRWGRRRHVERARPSRAATLPCS